MIHLCTIASGNYIPFVQTLFASLKKYDGSSNLHVLVTDNNFSNPGISDLYFYSIDDIKDSPLLNRIIHQYGNNNNLLRWALKPVFLSHLLEQFEKIIYVDNDIYFFREFSFLFNELEDHSILLTPHWFCETPFPYPENFETNFLIGQFNAGFIGASRYGLSFLNWWAEVCIYRMERNETDGFYDDQRYLDMAPIIDAGVKILRHRGCNIGSWNMLQNKRELINGEVLINTSFPIVFIHFNHETVRHILNGNDRLLKPYFEEYEETFHQITGNLISDYIPKINDWKNQSILLTVKRKLKIRTRIKNWLFQLSQKL